MAQPRTMLYAGSYSDLEFYFWRFGRGWSALKLWRVRDRGEIWRSGWSGRIALLYCTPRHSRCSVCALRRCGFRCLRVAPGDPVVLVGFKIGILFDDDQQTRKRAGKLVLCLLETLKSLRIAERVGIEFHRGRFAARFDDSLQAFPARSWLLLLRWRPDSASDPRGVDIGFAPRSRRL